jgi:hypothetical protein
VNDVAHLLDDASEAIVEDFEEHLIERHGLPPR